MFDEDVVISVFKENNESVKKIKVHTQMYKWVREDVGNVSRLIMSQKIILFDEEHKRISEESTQVVISPEVTKNDLLLVVARKHFYKLDELRTKYDTPRLE